MAIRIESQAEPIPGYKLLERLGGGGFGEVWKVEAPGGLLKAIKFVYGDLQAEDEEGVRRAEQELKALKRVKSVRHPYLLSLERYDIVDNRLLIVMELADRNLWDRFRECRNQGLQGIPRDELLRYMEEAAEVLDLMNEEYQLQHLDIKPQNLFLVHNHLKVADFGLVKDMQGKTATVTGGVTPVYAAPETFDGRVSRFCDQYSLAMVYQELLTGQRPFSGTSVQQLIMQHLTAEPNLEPLPASDRPVIARALAKDPEQRHGSCMELVRGLRQAGMGLSAAAAVPVTPTAPAAAAPPVTPAPPAAAAAPVASWGEAAAAPRVETPRPQPATPPEEPKAAPAPLRADGPAAFPRPVSDRPRPVPEQQPATEPQRVRHAVPEIKGDGLLQPTLVIALGGLGLRVVQRMRAALREHFGSLEKLPHLRFFHIDTDPEGAHEGEHGSLLHSWNQQEYLVARLNRPSHYLKPVGGRLRIDTWCSQRMLYRIPRNPLTTGVRALGRLAFFDHYPQISQHLQADLEAILQPDALARADQETRLGLRTNQPRVWVVTSLTGGTGSGMFIDLGYVLRYQLRGLGYENAQVQGLFLVPQVETAGGRPGRVHSLSLVNATSALIELHHFSTPATTFSTRYDERDAPITDRGPPFHRAVLLGLPEERDSEETRKLFFLAGDYLVRDLLTPLGRKADENRPAAEKTPVLQTFGLGRLTWPRKSLLNRAARQLCCRLVQRWTNKEAAPLRPTVQTWVAEQWVKQDLVPQPLIEHLQKACAQVLGQAPEDMFAAVLSPFVARGKKGPEITPPQAVELLDRLEQLVGRPEGVSGPMRPVLIAEPLDADQQLLFRACSKKVSQMAVCLVEVPDFRLAGAEESIRQMQTVMQQTLDIYEPMASEHSRKALAAYAQIRELIKQLQENQGSRRAPAIAAELLEQLQLYPKLRYQFLVMRRVINLYTSLRNQLSDQMRDIGLCRTRLVDLARAFEEVPATRDGDFPVKRYLLPFGCKEVEEAVEKLLGSITPEQRRQIEQQMQQAMQQQFAGLFQVCMSKSTHALKNLEQSLQQQAEAFFAPQLAGNDLVEMLLASHPEPTDAAETLARTFESAVPVLARHCASPELDILAVPASPRAAELVELARRACPETSFLNCDSPDDILFYREQPNLAFSELELLSPEMEETYQQLVRSDGSTPHCRADILQWLPVSAK